MTEQSRSDRLLKLTFHHNNYKSKIHSENRCYSYYSYNMMVVYLENVWRCDEHIIIYSSKKDIFTVLKTEIHPLCFQGLVYNMGQEMLMRKVF